MKFLNSMPARTPGVHWGEIVRTMADDDLVMLHIKWHPWAEKPQGVAAVDLFRVEDGKIVEHWDVIQDIPANIPHDNSMF